MIRTILFVLAVPVLGCAGMQANAVRVSALSPQPAVQLPSSKARLALDLTAIPDTFLIPEQDGVSAVPVEQWQDTLGAGFMNGLAPFFARPSGGSDYVLKFFKADLVYRPIAGAEPGVEPTVHARLTYKVEVLYRTGEIVQRLEGQTFSNSAWLEAGGSQATAEEVVAKMYEEIAERGLRTLPKILPGAHLGAALPSPTPAVVPDLAVPDPAPDSDESP